MAFRFVTKQAPARPGAPVTYMGFVQHEAVMSKKETYAYLADKLEFAAANIKAVFLGLKAYLKENAGAGNISSLNGIASVRNVIKGAFASASGPWVKGKNYIVPTAVELDPFKSTMTGVIPENKTDGAKPVVKSVMDNVTGEYDIITGQDAFTVAGTDLGPDTTKDDEFIGVRAKDGTLTKAEITSSELDTVKAAFPTALAAGEYTLVVATRSGLGDEYGIAEATRKITIK